MLMFAIIACGHKHTYSNEWSSDDTYHWHTSTCEHEGLIKNKAEHSFNEDNICTECNYKKKSQPQTPDTHEHTFSDEWSKDETHHWHSATCEHIDLVKDKERHDFDNYKCVICDYEISTKGLQYSLNIDGNSYSVVGMDSAETQIIIPATYNGKPITSIGDEAFKECNSIESVLIVGSVTSIGDSAFSGCSKLTSINIPDSLIGIGHDAFKGCNSLQYNEYHNGLYLGSNNNPYVLLVKAKNTEILSCITNNKTKIIYHDAFRNCTLLETAIIVGSVISIGDSAFYECSSLNLITVPNSVTSIGDYAFYLCSSLESVTINGVTSIGDFAFYMCESLASVTIPDSLIDIGDYAFQMCGKLESIIIPSSVTRIGKGALGVGGFYFLGGLKTVYYKGSAEEWENISIGGDNDDLSKATIYYYSKQTPTDDGNYWHYVNGEPTVWD